MPRQNNPPRTEHDDGWLITPRALTGVATVVGLVYTLHAPVRYVLRVGTTVDALAVRVTTLETEIDQQCGTIAAAEMVLAEHQGDATAAAGTSPGQKAGGKQGSRSPATP